MGPAKDLAPDRLQGAHDALAQAERAHADDAGSSKERDLAYIALRKSELATAYGQLNRDQRLRKQQEENYSQTQDRLRKNAEQRAENSERSLQAATGALARTQSEVESERARADAAMQSLRQMANVQEESRGLVITLEGSVLFTTGKSELMPLAQQKLDQVADALKQSESQRIVVEGYTDSKGADDANLKLSQARADAVRSYLVSKGVKQDSITAVGYGEDRPIASNDTTEGRANNRRVEIVVPPATAQTPKAKAAPTTPPAGNNSIPR